MDINEVKNNYQEMVTVKEEYIENDEDYDDPTVLEEPLIPVTYIKQELQVDSIKYEEHIENNISKCTIKKEYEENNDEITNVNEGRYIQESFAPDSTNVKVLIEETDISQANVSEDDYKIDTPFQCTICMIKYTRKNNLKRHMIEKHTEDIVKKYKGNDVDNNDKPLRCDICNVGFSQKNNLKIHLIDKHTVGIAKQFKCPQCSYRANCRSHLERHLYTHKDVKPYPCEICLMGFSRIDKLRLHMKDKHTGGPIKDFRCSQCPYQTNYKSGLRKHLNTHSDIKPHQCHICNMSFKHKTSLKLHIDDKHNEGVIKDYKCTQCTYETNHKRSFENHLNTHVKPFNCEICMIGFSRKDGLETHMKDKHRESVIKDFQCSKCSYQTNRKRNLQEHLNVHSDFKQFQCNICKLRFSSSCSLRKHLKNQHS